MSLFPEVLVTPVTVKDAIEDLSCIQNINIDHVWIDEWQKQTKGIKKVPTLKQGDKLDGRRRIRLYWDRPSPTLSKSIVSKPYVACTEIHPEQHRAISIREMARLSSYSNGFRFFNALDYGKSIIGNSVPPLFMKAIALQIRHKMWEGQKLEPYPKTMNYLEILEAAWQDHLKPRDLDAPTFISLFAGGGGSSLGYSMAGYRELLAVEWNDNAVETFKLNFPDVSVYHGDITKLSVDECMRLAGIQPGELDLLDGSPPCQGFSTAGKRILNDPRNQLFREYVRLLRGLKPKVFVMENVSGLVKGKMKLVFAEIVRELKASGYQVKCQLINAKYFYVPQSRERLIFIGVRDDLGIEGSYPKAENGTISVRKALKGIENLKGPLPNKGTKLAECCTRMRQGITASTFYNKNWGFNLYRLDWDKIAPTFTKRGGACGLIHPILPRKCIREEYQAIMSYPRRFDFIGKEEQARERIGNSVPPLFMRSIANHIRQEILSEINQKAKLTNA